MSFLLGDFYQMRIGVVGINHKQAPLELRERLAAAARSRFGAMRLLHLHHQFILLSTCNRTEIYFSSEDPAATHTYILNVLRRDLSDEFDQRLYSFFGVECFLHLSKVAAGLDSAILGESEIQGQVKEAYLNRAACSKELHYLFQKGLKNGKMVRNALPAKPGLPDIEQALYQLAETRLPKNPKVLFVGASAINHKIATYLKKKGLKLTFTNRTNEKGKKMAASLGADYLLWENFSHWTQYDWVIFGTKSYTPLLCREEIPDNIAPKLLTDLSLPRNVESDVEMHPAITLFNIDQLQGLVMQQRTELADAVTEAEKRLLEATKRQVESFMCYSPLVPVSAAYYP